MRDRAYTVAEINALRRALENKWLFGRYNPHQHGVMTAYSRIYSGEAEMVKCVEELLRAHMLAGHTAEDLYASEI